MTVRKSTLAMFLAIAVICGAALGIGGSKVLAAAGVGSVTVSADEYENMSYMAEKYEKAEALWDLVQDNYYQELTDEQMFTGLYKGIFESTGDPYSAYMTEEEYQYWMESTSGEFEGIGVYFGENEDGAYQIISVVAGAPAEKAGLKAGDILLAVDGETFDNINDMSLAIRGEHGTKVTITYERDGEENEVSVTRDTITEETVESEVLDGNIGYISISSFEDNTSEDFAEALADMEEKDVGGLIIDLRDNGGGIVSECLEIADELLDEGTLMYTVDHDGNKSYQYSEDGKTDLPYVLLVNENSASASEILAGAVKDNDGGKLVGVTTYGKGIIQSGSELSDGTGYKLTVMEYYSPDGNKIQETGISPDYEVENAEDSEDDAQLAKALSLLK